MAVLTRVAEFFGLDDEGWERHANPWSVYTRFAIFPALTLVLLQWGVWGWWTVLPVAALLIFTKINPRLFPAVQRNSGWCWAAVMGEKVWLSADARIPQIRLHWAGVLSIAQVFPVAIWLIGLIFLWPWVAIVGMLGTLATKLLFLDQMVKLYREVEGSDP
ncbi:MAG: DUF6653 family protein [Pseudomonadota bacterium]